MNEACECIDINEIMLVLKMFLQFTCKLDLCFLFPCLSEGWTAKLPW